MPKGKVPVLHVDYLKVRSSPIFELVNSVTTPIAGSFLRSNRGLDSRFEPEPEPEPEPAPKTMKGFDPLW